MFDQLQVRQNEGPTTFGEPGGNASFADTLARTLRPRAIREDLLRGGDILADVANAAERQQRTVDNVFAEARAQEEVYDRWIATVRAETGVELENPLRGGYGVEARRQVRRASRDDPNYDPRGGIPEAATRIFNERMAEVRANNPTLAGDNDFAFRFDDEARGVAREAEAGSHTTTERASAAGINPLLVLGAQFAGGLWAGRRDPIFLGSLFLGPTSAVGRTALTRIATAGLFQGVFNAGVSALEQPAVQAWRNEVGVRSGIMPAIENVGLAFLFGLIPGAAIRGIQEESARVGRAAAQRIIEGRPRPDDAETAVRALGEHVDPETRATVRMGEDMTEADRVTSQPRARDVSPELHDELNAAALRHADDPNDSPSPEAVALIPDRTIDAPVEAPQRAEPAAVQEIRARIEEAQPRTEREAQMVATEVIEEQGNKTDIARIRDDLERPSMLQELVAQRDAEIAARGRAGEAAIPQRAARDPLEKIPFINADGTPTTITRGQLAKVGQRDNEFAMLVRACK